MEEMNRLVSPGDVLAAVKTLHGQHATFLDYQVSPATASVQGFLSLILRVKVTVRVSPNQRVEESSFIVKRLPIMKEQLQVIKKSDFFDREIQYFKNSLPLLKAKIPRVCVVDCLIAHDDTIIMPDLCNEGFKTVSATMQEVSTGTLTLAHVRLAVRKLAEMHAASLGIDWLSEMPCLEKDALFEGFGRSFMESNCAQGCKSLAAVMSELYPGKYEKYAQWLLSAKSYKKITEYVRPSEKFLNVLSHGDFWENNMMFKSDPVTKKPIAVKFIDLQLVRYAPATRDLFYFLYLCTGKSFRDRHIEDILAIYVAAFNTAVCDTPDCLTLEMFKQEYDEGRLFGALLAATMKPILLMEKMLPGDKEEMTSEQLDQVMYGVGPDKLMKQFRENYKFKVAMTELLEELLEEMDKAKSFI